MLKGILLGYAIYSLTTMAYCVWLMRKAFARRSSVSASGWYSVEIIIAWYDCWIGCYYDFKKHRVYYFPVPMVGIMIDYDASDLGGE